MKKLVLVFLSVLLLASNAAYSKTRNTSRGYGLVQSYESRLFGWLRHFLPEYSAALQASDFDALPDIAHAYREKADEVGKIAIAIADLLAKAASELAQGFGTQGAKKHHTQRRKRNHN